MLDRTHISPILRVVHAILETETPVRLIMSESLEEEVISVVHATPSTVTGVTF